MLLFTSTVEWEDVHEGQWIENLQIAARDAEDADDIARDWLADHDAFASEVKIHSTERVPRDAVPASRGVLGHLAIDEQNGQTSWEPFER